MHLPTTQELLSSLPEGHQITESEAKGALALVPNVMEIMTGGAVERRTVHQRILLSSMPEKLAHYPVENVLVDGISVWGNNQTGVIYPELELSNYTVTYEVGHEREKMPAIVVATAKHLARYLLLRNEEDREEAKAAIQAMRLARLKLTKERETEGVSRTTNILGLRDGQTV